MNSEILNKIANYCAYQERSHSEVRTKLIQLGARGNDIEDAIIYLIENNYLNELRFAQHYIRGKFFLKKWGKVKILQSLKFHQISNYCIQKALKEIDNKVYYEVATELIVKKIKDFEKESSLSKKKKVFNYMMQKGYESHIIYEIMKDIEWEQ